MHLRHIWAILGIYFYCGAMVAMRMLHLRFECGCVPISLPRASLTSRYHLTFVLRMIRPSHFRFIRHLSHLSPLPAFVFDIDGVLLRGSKPIPRARDALSLLNQAKIPFILLTNGGGVSERARVEFLSNRLNIEISPLQIVQSHTPMRAWAQTGKYKRVMVVGGAKDNSRHVALEYGFEDVIMPIDIVRQDPAVSPHHRFTDAEFAEYARDVDLSAPIDSILVFNDPRDMNTDMQIVSDLLNSEGGIVGTKRQSLGDPTPAVPIAFSNNDYLWANDYNLPRFGQGAFRMIIERLYRETNRLGPNENLQRTIFGKPFPVQYNYAHSVLIEWNKILNGHKPHGFMPQLHEAPQNSPFSQIFMVGDNPLSDIWGANTNGWESILVRTGVFKDSDWDHTEHKPTVGVFDNVFDGVSSVLKSLEK